MTINLIYKKYTSVTSDHFLGQEQPYINKKTEVIYQPIANESFDTPSQYKLIHRITWSIIKLVHVMDNSII